VRRLKRRISIKQFHRWVAFSSVNPLDAADRFDQAIARFIVVYLASKGVKDAKMEDYLPYRIRRDDDGEEGATGLDPEILNAFVKSS